MGGVQPSAPRASARNQSRARRRKEPIPPIGQGSAHLPGRGQSKRQVPVGALVPVPCTAVYRQLTRQGFHRAA